jgi:hypothetical protein
MMDAKYYSEKILKLMPMFHNLAINLVGEDEPDINEILRQIAIDARREVLEEAAEIAFKEWSKCAKLPRIGIFAYTKRIIDAISSLEVK